RPRRRAVDGRATFRSPLHNRNRAKDPISSGESVPSVNTVLSPRRRPGPIFQGPVVMGPGFRRDDSGRRVAIFGMNGGQSRSGSKMKLHRGVFVGLVLILSPCLPAGPALPGAGAKAVGRKFFDTYMPGGPAH